jgi:hypothetical protein
MEKKEGKPFIAEKSMQYHQLIEKIKEKRTEEIRSDTSDYFECVIRTSNLNRLAPDFESCFGTPRKPCGSRPDRSVARYSEPYGGIRKGQTLYYAEEKGEAVMLLIWPWNNGDLSTVKIIPQIKTLLEPSSSAGFFQKVANLLF